MKSYPLFKYARPIIALLVVLGCFTFLFVVSRNPIPELNLSVVSQAQGFVLAVLGTVIGYYFGSSKDKSDQEELARTPNTSTTVSTVQSSIPVETVEDLKKKVKDTTLTTGDREAALLKLQALDPSFSVYTINDLP